MSQPTYVSSHFRTEDTLHFNGGQNHHRRVDNVATLIIQSNALRAQHQHANNGDRSGKAMGLASCHSGQKHAGFASEEAFWREVVRGFRQKASAAQWPQQRQSAYLPAAQARRIPGRIGYERERGSRYLQLTRQSDVGHPKKKMRPTTTAESALGKNGT